jgi:hypothetical protein
MIEIHVTKRELFEIVAVNVLLVIAAIGIVFCLVGGPHALG